MRLKLLQSLMRKNQRDIEFASLIKNDGNFRIAFDEVVTFVDVDETRKAPLFGEKLAFVRG